MVSAGRSGFAYYVKLSLAGRLFSNRGWPEAVGGIILGLVNILYLILANKPFSIYTGFLNWGQHIYSALGLDGLVGAPKASPLAERTSVGDIGLLLGALLAALAAGEFKLKRIGKEGYVDAVAGGLLMALGVVLAFGCNWGGFFSAITALSLHGYAMMVGLIFGGYLGLKYVNWRSARLFEKALKELELEAEAPAASAGNPGADANPGRARSPVALPAALILAAAAVAATWAVGGSRFAALMMLGVLVGVTLQRSRFCFATAFRDLLGGAEQARAARLQVGIALGIAVGATGAAALKYMGFIDPAVYVKPVGPLNIVGGILFGFGMSIAGGCASGSLWKAAEGNTGLMAALATAVLSYPLFKALLGPSIKRLANPGVFLPDVMGWAGALAFVYLSMLGWILFSLYMAYQRRVDPWG
ncbi:MAG: YeeE/YedE thiosulfate transporter family protein [Thermoproteota archaeon]